MSNLLEKINIENSGGERWFKKICSNEPMRYPLWQCVNNHILMKYVFLDQNLFQYLKFV